MMIVPIEKQPRRHNLLWPLAIRRLVPALVMGIMLMLGGCIMRQVVSLDLTNRGEIGVAVQFDRILLRYLADLYGVESANIEHLTLFSPTTIVQSLQEDSDLQNIQAETVGDDQLVISGHFDSLAGLPGSEAMLTWQQEGAIATLLLVITTEGVQRLLEYLALNGSLAADILLTPAETMSEAEYSDYIGWALEEYAPQQQLQNVLQNSGIEIVMQLPGAIVSHTGGRVDEQTFKTWIPFLSLLTLEEPLRYAVSYRLES